MCVVKAHDAGRVAPSNLRTGLEARQCGSVIQGAGWSSLTHPRSQLLRVQPTYLPCPSFCLHTNTITNAINAAPSPLHPHREQRSQQLVSLLLVRLQQVLSPGNIQQVGAHLRGCRMHQLRLACTRCPVQKQGAAAVASCHAPAATATAASSSASAFPGAHNVLLQPALGRLRALQGHWVCVCRAGRGRQAKERQCIVNTAHTCSSRCC